MLTPRRIVGAMPMSGCRGTDSFARLEEISNGTLVHYVAPEKFSPPRGRARLRHPDQPPDDVMDDIRESQREETGDTYAVTEKTMYCADREAVKQAIERAMDAQDHIKLLQKQGKLCGWVGPA